MTIGKTIALTGWTFVGKMVSLLFNTLSSFVIAFLPRIKYLLISRLQSPSAMILEPKKINGSWLSQRQSQVLSGVSQAPAWSAISLCPLPASPVLSSSLLTVDFHPRAFALAVPLLDCNCSHTSLGAWLKCHLLEKPSDYIPCLKEHTHTHTQTENKQKPYPVKIILNCLQMKYGIWDLLP